LGELGLIIFAAFFIGVLYLVKLRNYDIYDKEPFGIMLASFLVGGVVSIIVTTILYSFVNVQHTFTQAFYKVGLIEELAKLITFFLIYKIIRKHFDEIVDGVIYMSCIALGFAVIENISYALASESPFSLLAMRAFTSTIGHMAFSGIMGVALFVHFRVHKNWGGILLALVLAAFGHGFYDGVLFKSELNWMFFFVYGLIVISLLWVIRIVLSFSRFRKPFTFSLFDEKGVSEAQLCVNCGTRSQTARLNFWKIDVQNCSSCENLVFDFRYWKQVNRYYLPLRRWKKVEKGYKKSKTNPIRFGVESEHTLDVYVKMVSCSSESLSHWLVLENNLDKKRILSKPIIGWVLRGVGLKYMVEK